MSEPITTEQLAALVAAIDSGAEARGWNEGHQLVRVEACTGPDDIELGFKNIDGHPLETLMGFTAPREWSALGVCAEGWAASTDSGCRPSQAKGRMRMRTTVLVSRDGPVASGLRFAGEDFTPMPGGEGMILDALLRAMRLPTAPPPARFEEWLARLLFMTIAGHHRGDRRVGWAQLRPVLERYDELGSAGGTWEQLRAMAAKGHRVTSDLTAEDAAWMDEGMFARWVLGEIPSYDHLLTEARRSTTPEAFTQVRRQLRAWGLRSRVRRAA